MIRPRPALALAAVTLLGTSGSLLAITNAQAAPTQGSGHSSSGYSNSGSGYNSSGSGSGSSKSGYTKSGYSQSGYSKSGYSRSSYNKSGNTKSGYGNYGYKYGYKYGSGNHSSSGYRSSSTGQQTSQGTTQTSGGQSMLTLTSEQNDNARTIIAVAKGAGLPERAQVVAIATALQESTLQNLTYGDRDSQGLFQQRPSAGWGSTSEITDPATSAKLFFGVADNAETQGLTQIDGWQSMSVAEAAQSTQISAFPDAYAKWQKLAEQTVAANQDVAPIS